MSRVSVIWVSVLILATGISLVDPPYWKLQALQQAGTLVVVLGVILLGRIQDIRPAAIWTTGVFGLLHIIGARWIYSYVPYDQMMDAVLGFSPEADWGWERNHYDRFVHFMHGLLLFWPVYYWMLAKGFPRRACMWMAFMSVPAFAAVYEVFEWMLTFSVNENQAESYNGQQGDTWDAQKDMALATLGVLLAVLMVWVWSKRKAAS